VESEKSPLRRLLTYTRHQRPQILWATAFSILNKLFDLAPPLLIGAAVDITVRREDSLFGQLGLEDPVHQLYLLAVMTFIIWALESLFEYAYKVYWMNIAQQIEHKLRMDTYRHLQGLELEYFEDRQTGGLMAILNDDVNQLERFLNSGANDLIQVSTTVIAISLAFFIFSPLVALLALIPIPMILFFSVRFQRRLKPKYADVRSQVGILNARLSNNLTGIATIKSFTAEDYEASRIEQASNQYLESNRRAIVLSSAFSPLIRMVIVAGFIAMLVVGGIQTMQGVIEIGAYSVIIFLIQRLLWPLTRLGETFDHYQRAMASTTRTLDLLDTEQKITSGDKNLQVSDVKGDLVFAGIDFSYKGREKVLDAFDFTVKSGATVALVGSTGCGKSTIVKLLLRYYDPTAGTITLDGHDLRDLSLKDLRQAIGLVSQESFLIDGTVRENIAYGNPDTKLADIIEAAKIAEVHEFVESLPDRYDTLVGERGQKLSGGQRQRIAIARVVLKDPPILIFDEATSSVDNETEAAIQRSIQRLTVGRTTIVIAHRLSTIRKADQIYVIGHGGISERGTHDELIALDGQYASLWQVQTGETS